MGFKEFGEGWGRGAAAFENLRGDGHRKAELFFALGTMEFAEPRIDVSTDGDLPAWAPGLAFENARLKASLS